MHSPSVHVPTAAVPTAAAISDNPHRSYSVFRLLETHAHFPSKAPLKRQREQPSDERRTIIIDSVHEVESSSSAYGVRFGTGLQILWRRRSELHSLSLDTNKDCMGFRTPNGQASVFHFPRLPALLAKPSRNVDHRDARIGRQLQVARLKTHNVVHHEAVSMI